jgi:GDPmannose 4,6-dehydratase
MKAVIIGSRGQDGVYLTELLLSKRIEVIGVSRNNLDINVDLADFNAVKALLENYKPDYIFHLAAKSTTSHEALFQNYESIVTGSLNLLEAIRLYSPNTKIFLSGSGLQFKNEGHPLNEFAPLQASSAYSMARIQSLYAARYYQGLGLRVYFGYFFNHDSPLRTEKHVSQMIASAVKRISMGEDKKIKIGNYNVRKEWGFAGDIVKGIWILVNQEQVYEAVIGTGKAYSIKDWLKACFNIIGKNWEDYVETEMHFVSEYDILVSDPGTILSLGWKPEVSFEELAKMMVS